MTLPWFIRRAPRSAARVRLFCFPHAGVGASAYREWPDGLPEEIDLWAIQPPGRESRLAEPAFGDMRELVAAVVERIAPYLAPPFALFGHSMGAVVAFETARRLRSLGAPAPFRLFVSGRRAPRLPNPEPPLHTLPDAVFVAELQLRYGGIPDQILQHRDLLALLLPGLRADVAALERYVYEADALLDCPISAFGGADDPRASRHELASWGEETRATAGVRLFPGGHFYLQDARRELLDEIASLLRPVTASERFEEART